MPWFTHLRGIRNRLNLNHAEDLVFIHNNLLLSNNSNEYEDEKTKMWDIGGDAYDSMDDVGYIEFAESSLDEPALENKLIGDNAWCFHFKCFGLWFKLFVVCSLLC